MKVENMEEIKILTFHMGLDKALGLDGFPTIFYHTYWDIIKYDLLRETKESRRKSTILGAINHTFIALVPKKK